MAGRKIEYRKQAITLDQQIERLRRQGVVIGNEGKARECLADIGYYRLGFYTLEQGWHSVNVKIWKFFEKFFAYQENSPYLCYKKE